MRGRTVTLAALALGLAAGAVRSMGRQDGFPHEEHVGLFPTCLGCHAGIPDGREAADYSVTPSDCSGCHDGERARRVDWSGPAPKVTNLDFSHPEHVEEVAAAGDAPLECARCHQIPGTSARLAVARAGPDACTGCHAHEAPSHLAGEAACRTCHRPLVRAAGLSAERIAAFPRPPSHDRPDFLLEHGEAAEATGVSDCAVCHARQTCVRCHLDAGRVAEIAALPPDPRVASLEEGKTGTWPEPASHEALDWELEHGREAGLDPASCSTCHAEASCRTCHGAARVAAIEEQPRPGPGGPTGVTVERARPPGHTLGFATSHGTAVASDLPRCSSCHVEQECVECHQGIRAGAAGSAPSSFDGVRHAEARSARVAPDTVDEEGRGGDAGDRATRNVARRFLPPDPGPGYHPDNFILRHGAEAFAVQTSCSDCHSTEVFCRECHESTGTTVGPSDGAGGAFHDAQPDWLFEHGRAARQGIEQCATCHRQSSCLRCHSARSGLRIDPHGPDFDPGRVADRSTISCGICHSSEILDRLDPP